MPATQALDQLPRLAFREALDEASQTLRLSLLPGDARFFASTSPASAYSAASAAIGRAVHRTYGARQSPSFGGRCGGALGQRLSFCRERGGALRRRPSFGGARGCWRLCVRGCLLGEQARKSQNTAPTQEGSDVYEHATKRVGVGLWLVWSVQGKRMPRSPGVSGGPLGLCLQGLPPVGSTCQNERHTMAQKIARTRLHKETPQAALFGKENIWYDGAVLVSDAHKTHCTVTHALATSGADTNYLPPMCSHSTTVEKLDKR